MDIEALRGDWHRATEHGRTLDAIKALIALERAVPKDALWSQRLGESYRRAGQLENATAAFARACERFVAQGFLPRAIAMAKLVGGMDPARGDLLEGLLPKAQPPAVQLPKPVKPARLVLVEEATEDEIRFVDTPESSVTLLLEDFGKHDSIDVEFELDDDDIFEEEPTPAALRGSAEALDEAPADPAAAMASFRLFASLSREALVALARASELVEFPSRASVIVRSEPASSLFAVVTGTAKVHFANGSTVDLEEGDIFGEAALLLGGERQADVVADGPLMALRIDKSKLDRVTTVFPEVEDALFELLARRLIINIMASSPLFTAFELKTRFELAQLFEVRRADAGTIIAERGRKSDGLYLLLAGNIVAESSGTAARIALGSAFGHGTLLGQPVATATIRAVSESILLRMPATSFSSFAMQYPPALAHLAETSGP